MNISPVSPIVSANLNPLRANFERDQVAVLESIFRTIFDTLGQMQHTIAKVINANTAQPTWIAPTLTNSWVWYGSVSYEPKYSKDEQGLVRLRGMIKSGVITSSAFNLPSGYRPAQSVRFAVVSNAAFGEIQVNPNGDVIPSVGSNLSISLEGVSFFAEA
jgi:hypothetical protein